MPGATFTLIWPPHLEAGLWPGCETKRFDAGLDRFPRMGEEWVTISSPPPPSKADLPSISLTKPTRASDQSDARDPAWLRRFPSQKGSLSSLLERTILHAIERRNLLVDMRKSEARFRSLFEDSRIGMVLLDPTGRVEEINSVAQKLLPSLPEEGGDAGDLFPGEADTVRKAFGDLGKTKGVESLHLPIAGRSQGWAQVTFSPVTSGHDSFGVDMPVVMIVRDITREMVVTRERDLMATFPELNPHPVFRIDIHGICDYANRGANEMLREWGIGQGLPTPPPLTLAAREAFAIGLPREFEQTVEGRIFSFVLAPIKAFDRIYVYGRDVTEQRQGVRRLRRAALVFDNTDDGVLITGRPRGHRSVNAAFTRITGYDEKEAVGKSPSILRSDRHEPSFYAELWDNLHKKGAWEGEIWNRQKSGAIYLQHSRIRAVYDDAGTLTEFVSIFSDVTGARMRAEELERQAYNDPLTGLPNRFLFHDRLGMAISRARRSQSTFALMYLDLDGFKEVNDKGGHLVGDKTLQWVGKKIGAAIRDEDTLARLGGDEFAIIAEAPADRNIVGAIADRIHKPFADGVTVEGTNYPVSVSIGVAFFAEDAEDRQHLIEKADDAMYKAKEAGKRTTCYASDLKENKGKP